MMRRIACVLMGHDHRRIAHARWSWCKRCRRNIYTGGRRGR